MKFEKRKIGKPYVTAADWRETMEVKRTIKIDVESFEMGDVISFKLKDGEKVQAKAVKKTDEGMLFLTVDCLKDEYQMFKNPGGMGSMEINYFNSDLRHALNGEILDRFRFRSCRQPRCCGLLRCVLLLWCSPGFSLIRNGLKCNSEVEPLDGERLDDCPLKEVE